jgi:diacylglycerol kinase family enzyme
MNGSVFDCDLGRLNDSYFVYVAAFGAFVDVSYDTPQDMKNALGHVAYLLRGVQSLAAIKTYNMHFESAEMSGTGNFILGMITNSNSVGGFKGITGRDVTLNDGMFEVTLVRMPGMAAVDIPAMVNAVLTGTPNRYIVTFKTARLELWFDQEISWTRDGEFGGNHRHVVIENLARALPIVVPTETEEETPELEANLF